jgi:hypothetical protein
VLWAQREDLEGATALGRQELWPGSGSPRMSSHLCPVPGLNSETSNCLVLQSPPPGPRVAQEGDLLFFDQEEATDVMCSSNRNKDTKGDREAQLFWGGPDDCTWACTWVVLLIPTWKLLPGNHGNGYFYLWYLRLLFSLSHFQNPFWYFSFSRE